MKIQVNSQGKAYLTSQNKVLEAIEGADTITATNNTGGSISTGDKVMIHKSGSNYVLFPVYSDIPNFVKSGDVAVVDKRAYNFYTYRHIDLFNIFNPAQDTPWEVQLKVLTPTSITRRNLLIGSGDGFFRGGFSIELNNQSKFGAGISSDNSSWNIGWMSGTTTVSTNTIYWIKIAFDGSKYSLELSVDGVNYNTEATITSSTKINPSRILIIGNTAGNGDYWLGSVYLDGCYIKYNGQIWWSAYFPNTYDDVLTGIATENIASGSTGSVKTILAEG